MKDLFDKFPPIQHVIEGKPPMIRKPRHYLGLSMLGHECARYLWYYLHWTFNSELSNKAQRIFERGDLEEPRIIRDLEAAGCTVTGTQTSIEVNAYIKGHCDGIVEGMPYQEGKALLEIKTMNAKSFAGLRKHGAKHAVPGYYAQMILYMALLELPEGLLIVTNKDTEERYYELIPADYVGAEELLYRALDIVNSPKPPEGLHSNPDWFQCKFCNAKEVCHYGQRPERNCRTCEHVIKDDGWQCGKTQQDLSNEQQEAACEQYTLSSWLST